MANNKRRQPETSQIATPHRHALLRPFLDGEATLQQVALDSGVSYRTVQRWLARYRVDGPAGLARRPRADATKRKLSADLVALTEGLALSKPRLPVAVIYRQVRQTALARDGRKGGRPRKLTAKQVAMARQLLQDPKQQVTEVAKMLGVARSTLYMALRSESTVKGDK